MTVAAYTQPESSADATDGAESNWAVRLHSLFALLFLLVGAELLLVSYVGVGWPTVFGESRFAEFFSYGRSLPMAMNALVFGWLTLGLVAVIYYLLPRVLGTVLALRRIAAANAAVMFLGVAAGVAAIGAGQGEGGRLLEMPWYSDLALVASFLVTSLVVGATVRKSGRDRVGVAAWYLIAAPWWLLLSYVAGAIPGLGGAPAELQSAFTATAVFGMWIAPVAVGGGYALIARLVPDAEFHPRLGRIGFWSLGVLWAWTAARTLQYGPMGDWMETMPILFSSALTVAALAIAADFALALRGKWDEVTRSLPLQLYAAGTSLFLLLPGHMLIQSLRSPSSVVRFTGWEAAFDLLAVMGAFSLWTAALLAEVLAAGSGRRWAGASGAFIGVPIAGGVLFAAGTRWVAGLQQGYTWLAGAQSSAYENSGDGFFNTVAPLKGTDQLTAVGVMIAVAGVLVFVIGAALRLGGSPTEQVDNDAYPSLKWAWAAIPAGLAVWGGNVALGTPLSVNPAAFVLVALGLGFAFAAVAMVMRPSPEAGVQIEFAWPDEERPSVVRRGAAAAFALTVLAVFVFPAVDADRDPTLLADATRNLSEGSEAHEGREIYVAEGCWYCHTQQVRAIVTDVGLGAVSTSGDYAHDPAGVFGVARLGPDLAHAGSRAPTNDPAWVEAHLADPRAERSWSTMPAYRHLTDSEMTALATYIAGLE